MNLTFAIGASLLMAVVAGLLVWPLLRTASSGRAASRKAINAAIYRDQLTELTRDKDNGILSAEDYEKSKDEVERRVLEDTVDEPATVAPTRTGVSRTALALLVLIPLLSVPLYLKLGSPAAIGLQGPVAAGERDQITPEKIEAMVSALAAKLEQNPNNPQGWSMLIRSYKAMGRMEDAERALAKAGALAETQPALMMERIDLDTQKTGGRMSDKSRALLGKVLKLEPENPMALVYAGEDAYFRQQYAKAAEAWGRLLKQVEPGSDDAKNLSIGIARAKALAGKKGPAPTVLPWMETAAAPASTGGDMAASAITGLVDLAPALKAKASPGDTVFIFARAVQGSRMPLAVVKATVADLPLKFTLDDSLAMSPELKLSGAAEVNVEARVSKSGDPMAKPGDLTGGVGPVLPGSRDVKVHIDRLVP